MIDLADNAERALRMVREAKDLSYDTETSGVDWRYNNPIGYVIGTHRGIDGKSCVCSTDDVVYVPVRHGGGGNLLGGRPLVKSDDAIDLHPFEKELAKAFDDRNRLKIGPTVGHNTKFDCHMSANAGIMLGRGMVCTQNIAALLDEYQRSFSLDNCAQVFGVEAKKGEELYAHMARLFGGTAARGQMENYWRLAGNDPISYNYAIGDGVTTMQLWAAQMHEVREQELDVVCELENNLIWTLFRMERTGIPVDVEQIGVLRHVTEARISEMMRELPAGFNARSPVQMKQLMESNGYTDWPKTEKGNPSFTEGWLKRNPIGKKIIEIRQASNLLNSFVNPLADRHMFKGRVHATLNQLKSDDKGTISGRFSCSDPNLQQVPKRVKELAKPFRRLFIADEGWIFWERDWSQCLVAGTQVMVPGGTKNIEDMKPGDDVYSYDDAGKLVIRKVLDAWCTGERETVKIKWRTNGRTEGELECTPDHPIRLIDGTYKTPQQMCEEGSVGKRGQTPYWVPVMALRRASQRAGARDYKATYLYSTGKERVKESRLVFEHYAGYSPEHVHHIDGNPQNNWPENLKGISAAEHGALHNHAITHIIPQVGVRKVYDITVEGTHNFIANEICVHNCEPRLFAHYSQDPNLLAGYNATPFVDAHSQTAKLLNVERDPTAKRMNMGIFTGMQAKALAGHMNCSIEQAEKYLRAWFSAYPTIKGFQEKAKMRLRNRGYVKTILGRRCRLESAQFAYRGTSKIIQGGNADIMKYILLKMDRYCEDNGDITRVLMTVHDSFNGQYQDTPEGRAAFEEMIAMMEDVKSEPLKLTVPFVAEGHEGKNWSEASFGPEK